MSTAAPSKLPPAVQLSQMIVSLWVPQAVHAAELGLADVLSGGSLSSRATPERTQADSGVRRPIIPV